MSEREESLVDYVEIGIQLIQLAAKLAPVLGAWLASLLDGRDDPLSLRVRDILPEESRSRAVQRELGG
ncbi:hypothetical protein [Pendulispora albinea]|uniref:Uncharacterized protein n=1 Tax=Pendulispora albinea TaxID=2741071 RepID=A0ABZ2LZZ4_9BACT